MQASPVDKVIKLLTENGHRLIPSPLAISGLKFTFPAVLSGPDGSSDLIIVVDTADEPDNSVVLRRVLAVARALDVARYNNPLTTIVVGPKPSKDVLSEMMSVSRVLPVGSLPSDQESANQVLMDWLAVLAPLPPIELVEEGLEPLAELKKALNKDTNKALLSLVDAAVEGQEEVAARVNAQFEKALAPIVEEGK